MRNRHWYIALALSLSFLPANLWGGDHLKKLVPMQLKNPPACPPVEIPCEPSPDASGTVEGSENGVDIQDDQGSAIDSQTRFSGGSSMDLSGLNADRSSYASLQTLSSIGDFFAPDGQLVVINRQLPIGGTYIEDFNNQPVSPGAGIGRFKTSDSNSPIPRDRLFLDYSLFHNARLTPDDVSVQRFTPGFEKTFMDGLTSLELRLPIAMTLNSSNFGSSNDIDTQNSEFGNIAIAAKGILWSRDGFVLTSGLVLQTPTADDIIFGNGNGEEALRIGNNQYRLLPYLATLHYNDEWFWQNYIQIDAAANGNKVYVNSTGRATDQIGVLQEQNYLYLDTSLSRWLRRDRCRQTGIAMTVELHYNSTINNTDTISFSDNRGNVDLGTAGFSADVLNMNIGPTFVYGATTTTIAYGTPLTADRGMDGELRILLNRLF